MNEPALDLGVRRVDAVLRRLAELDAQASRLQAAQTVQAVQVAQIVQAVQASRTTRTDATAPAPTR